MSKNADFVDVNGTKVPTNKYAAQRPYCAKHSRAMLDIGGKKQCPACVQESRLSSNVEKAVKS